jgi:hypothetical protein
MYWKAFDLFWVEGFFYATHSEKPHPRHKWFMKKLLLVSFSVALLGHGCKKDELDLPVIAACGVDNPIEDLEWLSSEIRSRQNDTSMGAVFGYIEQALNEGETIFIFNDCNPAANSVATLLDCSGTVVGFLGDENHDVANLTGRTVIFRRSDTACTLD